MKILIVHKNWLGDVLFELPAVEAIRRNFPEAEIVSVAPARCRQILQNHPDIDSVLIFDEKREHRFWPARLQFALSLRQNSWDRVYLFHPSRTRAFLFWLAGVKERIGYGRDRRFFLTQPVNEPTGLCHRVDYFLELLRQTGLQMPAQRFYRFFFSEQDTQRVERRLAAEGIEEFVCFHVGANWEPKRWPPAHFSALADLIYQRSRLPVILTGSPADENLGREVIAFAREAIVHSWIGTTQLGELGALFSRARFVVSGDSGPMHIASGVGTPVVALFGPTDPAVTGPRGTGEKIILTHVPQGYRVPWYGPLPADGWLKYIHPEKVMNAIQEKGWLTSKLATASYRSSDEKKGLALEGTKAKEILLVTLSNIGDVIMTTPVIMALVGLFPSVRLTVVASPKTRELLEESRYIDRLVIYDKKAGLKHKLDLIRKLRQRSYDLVVDLRNTMIPFLVKSRKRSPWLRHYRCQAMRERHLEVLEMMGLRISKPLSFDFYDATQEASLLAKLKDEGIREERGWIVVAPCAASELKTWPLEKFGELIRRLLADFPERVLIVGDERERLLAAPLTKIDPLRVHLLAGKTSLRELAALIARCSLLVSNDSAVMHLGYELNRPVVAIFGPTHPGKYAREGPFFRMVREELPCAPCESPRCHYPRQWCFENLQVEKVFDACRELLVDSLARKD